MKTHKFSLFLLSLFLTYAIQAQYILKAKDVKFSNGEITAYLNPTEKNIIIPDNFSGNPVTSIGEGVFFNAKLKSIVVPNSVISIGSRAFMDNFLATVTIPNSVTNIGKWAFYANQLTSIVLPVYQGYSYYWTDGTTTYQSTSLISDFSKTYTRGTKGSIYNFSLTYNLNGGASTNPSTYTIKTPTIALSKATRENAFFEGWFTDANFTNEISTIENGSTGDLILFAKFREIVTNLFETNQLAFSIYPNPTDDYIHTDKTLKYLKIMNMRGEVVIENVVTNHFFNVSELTAGKYMIVATDDNSTYKTTFIKK